MPHLPDIEIDKIGGIIQQTLLLERSRWYDDNKLPKLSGTIVNEKKTLQNREIDGRILNRGTRIEANLCREIEHYIHIMTLFHHYSNVIGTLIS